MTKTIVLFAAIAFLLPACNKPADKAPPPVRDEDNPVMKLPEAYADKDGIVSLTFNVAKFIDPKQYGGGATNMTIEARHKSMPMRFDITVSKHGVAFMNPGGGDQFYRELDELFGTNSPKPMAMRALTKFNVEALEGDLSELDKGPAKAKVLHSNGAQFLLIVDWKEKKVEIREIDKKYRQQIIEAFKV